VPYAGSTRYFACPKYLDEKDTNILLDCFFARMHDPDFGKEQDERLNRAQVMSRYRILPYKK
jgi:hypothetical protein